MTIPIGELQQGFRTARQQLMALATFLEDPLRVDPFAHTPTDAPSGAIPQDIWVAMRDLEVREKVREWLQGSEVATEVASALSYDPSAHYSAEEYVKFHEQITKLLDGARAAANIAAPVG